MAQEFNTRPSSMALIKWFKLKFCKHHHAHIITRFDEGLTKYWYSNLTSTNFMFWYVCPECTRVTERHENIYK